METRKIVRYGWHPGLPDANAPKFGNLIVAQEVLPPAVDLRNHFIPVYDQGMIGSCVANAVGGLVQYQQRKDGKPPYVPSRLFIYWNARNLEGTVGQDAGASIADGIKVVHHLGVPHESLWWYNVSKFAEKPGANVFGDAARHKVASYLAVNNLNLAEMKQCLAMGHPFVFGVSVYPGFESAATTRTGVVPMPGKQDNALGGHAMLAVGYEDSHDWFIVRNSWGGRWGAAGHCYVPYDYLASGDLCADCWTIHSVA